MRQKFIFLLLVLLILLIIFTYLKYSLVPTETSQPLNEKACSYITMDFWTLRPNTDNGLGNQMYEIAALHGIAATLTMKPFLSEELRVRVEELQKSFPKMIPLLMEIPNDTKAVEFGTLWAYNNVSILHPYKKFNIRLTNGKWYQSYRYFHHISEDIRVIFSFKEDVLRAAKAIIQHAHSELKLRNINLMKEEDDASIFACLHIRRGDFVNHPFLLESRADFVLNSVEYIRKTEKLGKDRIVKLMVLSDDREWAKSVLGNDSYAFIPPHPSEKTVDLAIMAKHCNIIVLTASVSTFGFWGAYLSEAENVYYNTEIEKYKNGSFKYIFNPTDTFLPSWIALNFSSTGATF